MAHGAAVGYVLDDGRVRGYYSHYGASNVKLAFGPKKIAEDTPLGGDRPEHQLEGAVDPDTDVSPQCSYTDPRAPPVDHEDQVEMFESLTEWAAEYIDYLQHEAAYVVDTRTTPWEVRAFKPVRRTEEDDRLYGELSDPGVLIELDAPEGWNSNQSVAVSTADEFAEKVDDKYDDVRSRVPPFSPLLSEWADSA